MIQNRCIFIEACLRLRQSNILTRGLGSKEVLGSQWMQTSQYGCSRVNSFDNMSTSERIWNGRHHVRKFHFQKNIPPASALTIGNEIGIEKREKCQAIFSQNNFNHRPTSSFKGLCHTSKSNNIPMLRLSDPSTNIRHYSTLPSAKKYNLTPYGIMKFNNKPAEPPSAFNWNIIKNLYFEILAWVIRMQLDKNFRIKSLLEGAKTAVMAVSSAMAEGRYDQLEGLVEDKARSEIEVNCSNMSEEKRRLLEMTEEDCMAMTCSVYLDNLRIIGKRNGNVELEASVVIKYLRNAQDLLPHPESTEKPNFNEVLEKVCDNLQICLYIFRKKIAKDTDNDWIIRRLEHFAPIQDIPNH